MAGHSEDKGFFGNHYVKVYAVLLVLLAVSIAGPWWARGWTRR